MVFSLTNRERLFDAYIAFRQLSSAIRDLPDFLIIGVQKGGTTSLYRYLSQHPSILPARKKEIQYFSRNFYRSINWYRAHFPIRRRNLLRQDSQSEMMSGEASPYYIFHPAAAKRMSQVIPDARLIVLLRNPVDRAYSHYRHNIRHKSTGETLSLKDAISAEQKRLSGEVGRLMEDVRYDSHSYRQFSYLSRGLYLDQLERLWQYYPQDQILILSSELFFTDTANVYIQALRFLNLPEWGPQEFHIYNPGDSSSHLESDVREYLIEYFRPYNLHLFERLGIDFGWER